MIVFLEIATKRGCNCSEAFVSDWRPRRRRARRHQQARAKVKMAPQRGARSSGRLMPAPVRSAVL
jgi:hypothetical protein